MKHTLLYRINLIIFLFVYCLNTQAQNDTIINKPKNTSKLKYGLRIGGDLGKLLRSALDDEYKGFEIVGDFRLKKNLYIAAEIGAEEKHTITDYLDITSTGSYLKAGIDCNMYENWLNMDNMIYLGFRVGASTFNHELNSATIYTTNQYWPSPLIMENNQKFNGLNAFWGELQLGLKAEIFTNFYMGLNVQLRILANESKPENFENVYIPGFGRTYDSSAIGAGYSYTLTYRIPFFKKG